MLDLTKSFKVRLQEYAPQHTRSSKAFPANVPSLTPPPLGQTFRGVKINREDTLLGPRARSGHINTESFIGIFICVNNLLSTKSYWREFTPNQQTLVAQYCRTRRRGDPRTEGAAGTGEQGGS